MLTIVIANPIQFDIVSAVPLNSGGAAAAIIVENCGESEITNMPQRHKAIINNCGGSKNNSGETKQNIPDISNELYATFLLPFLIEINPPSMQDNAPTPILMNDQNET